MCFRAGRSPGARAHYLAYSSSTSTHDRKYKSLPKSSGMTELSEHRMLSVLFIPRVIFRVPKLLLRQKQTAFRFSNQRIPGGTWVGGGSGKLRGSGTPSKPFYHAVFITADKKRAAQTLRPDARVQLFGFVNQPEAAPLKKATE